VGCVIVCQKSSVNRSEERRNASPAKALSNGDAVGPTQPTVTDRIPTLTAIIFVVSFDDTAPGVDVFFIELIVAAAGSFNGHEHFEPVVSVCEFGGIA